MKTIPVFTKDTLIRANRKAIAQHANYTLRPAKLKELDANLFYPVTFHMMHGDGECIRCHIVINAEGQVVMLDVPIGIFNELPRQEIDVTA